MNSVLEFRRAVRSGLTRQEIAIAKTAYQTRREYMDVWVNNRALVEILDVAFERSGRSDAVSPFDLDLPWEQSAAQEFSQILVTKRGGDLPSGRCALLGCPECGDLGCGSYAAFIRKNESGYIWEDFAWENTYEDPAAICGVGPFYFEGEQYEATVNEALAVCMQQGASNRQPWRL